MALQQSPPCQFGMKAPPFKLPDTELRMWDLRAARGATGLLVAFLSNSHRSVQAVLRAFVEDARLLQLMGIGVVAINPVLASEGEDESIGAMARLANNYEFNFPYLKDETQQTARAFDVAVLPEFFGFNANMELQYRGRLDASLEEHLASECPRELVDAMRQVAITGQGPREQKPSRGTPFLYQRRIKLGA